MPARKRLADSPAIRPQPYDKATFHAAVSAATTAERLDEIWALAEKQGYATHGKNPDGTQGPPARLYSAVQARRAALTKGG